MNELFFYMWLTLMWHAGARAVVNGRENFSVGGMKFNAMFCDVTRYKTDEM